MMLCSSLGLWVQRRTVQTKPGPSLKEDQDELVSLRSKVLIPGKSVGRLRSIVPVSVLVLVLMGSQLVSVEGALTEDQEETLVELHNRYRGIVHPSASAMLPLRWDGHLKLVAEGYAAKCVWNHNPELTETGENLFAGTGVLDLERALEKWFLEHLDYSYDNNSCLEDRMCGHYTQMVWADTHSLGCAVHVCAQMEGLGWAEPVNFLVCNYYPTGNYEGERPYVEGDWCSQCPENLQRCVNNLCVFDSELTDDEDEEVTVPGSEEPSLNPSPDPHQDPDQDPDQVSSVQMVVGQGEKPGEEQEAVVPPPATETIPKPPTTTETTQEPPTFTESPQTGLGPGSEPELEPEPEQEPESSGKGPTECAVVHTEEAEIKTPPPAPQTPPPAPQTPASHPHTPPPHPETPPPENRGQQQKDFVEKRNRVETMLQSSSTVPTASLILVFIWICLNLV